MKTPGVHNICSQKIGQATRKAALHEPMPGIPVTTCCERGAVMGAYAEAMGALWLWL